MTAHLLRRRTDDAVAECAIVDFGLRAVSENVGVALVNANHFIDTVIVTDQPSSKLKGSICVGLFACHQSN